MYKIICTLLLCALCALCVHPVFSAVNRYSPLVDERDMSGRGLFIRTLHHRGIRFMISDKEYDRVLLLVYSNGVTGMVDIICNISNQYSDFSIDVLYIKRIDGVLEKYSCDGSVERPRRESRKEVDV